jgi:hypothetical protein
MLTQYPQFLDFSTLPSYHSSFFTSVTPRGPLEPNQLVTIVFVSMGKMDAVVNTNTPSTFTWTGSIPLLFSGAHSFKFDPLPGGRTKFTQEEVFSGALGWIMGEGWVAGRTGMREKTRIGWGGFNEDLKRWCEEGKSQGV